MKSTPGALLAILLVFLPSCVFAAGNRAAAHDVEKPLSDPPQPESKLTTVDFGAGGLSDVVYQAPADRAFILRDIYASIPCDVVAEVAGNSIPLMGWWMFEVSSAPAPVWRIQLRSGAKLPPGSALRVRRPANAAAPSAEVFVAGDLVRM